MNNKFIFRHTIPEVIYMSRRYYRKHNLLGITRGERNAFEIIVKFIQMIIYIIRGIIKGIIECSIYIRKMSKSHRALKGIGYNLNNILDMIYEINPRQFEIFCAELFRQCGKYDNVEITQASHDYGRDVICTRKNNGFKEITFVECKHYNKDGFKIGREIAQKLLGSCQMLNADKGIIITTGTYHRNAYEVAGRVNNLVLMDITDIENMIFNLEPSQVSKVILRTLNAS